jgi:preprotein translocase subunit SecE
MQNTTKPSRDASSVGSIGSISDYLNGVQEELKKAIWPTREELLKMTQIVLFLIVVVALYCGGVDAILGVIMKFVLNSKPTG